MKKLKKKYKSTNCYRKVPHLNKIIERKKGNLKNLEGNIYKNN